MTNKKSMNLRIIINCDVIKNFISQLKIKMLTEAISNVVRLLSLTSARTQYIDCVFIHSSNASVLHFTSAMIVRSITKCSYKVHQIMNSTFLSIDH